MIVCHFKEKRCMDQMLGTKEIAILIDNEWMDDGLRGSFGTLKIHENLIFSNLQLTL
jgi:hypothetical protein